MSSSVKGIDRNNVQKIIRRLSFFHAATVQEEALDILTVFLIL